MRCPHCGRMTPAGVFCTHCGASLPTGDRLGDPRRFHAFATHPREGVLHLSIITTLFPHLDRQRSQQARWLLLAGVVIIVLLGLSRFIPLAIVLAALLLPLLYLGSLVLAERYADVPWHVLLATFGSGFLLGAVQSMMSYRIILPHRSFGVGLHPGYVLLTGIVIPLIAQALMLVGPVMLYVWLPRFAEPIDGLVFGAASGLGFAAAQSIIYSWLLIVEPVQRGGQSLTWLPTILWILLLIPLLDAATTSMICLALWLRRDLPHGLPPMGRFGRLEVAVPWAWVGQIIPSLGFDLLGNQSLALVWYGVTTAVALVLLRMQIHRSVLAHAQAKGAVAMAACPHCHHSLEEGAFCPHCGLALRSQVQHRAASSRATGGGA
jgi:hypothetical protein